jgi:hypothetical protein
MCGTRTSLSHYHHCQSIGLPNLSIIDEEKKYPQLQTQKPQTQNTKLVGVARDPLYLLNEVQRPWICQICQRRAYVSHGLRERKRQAGKAEDIGKCGRVSEHKAASCTTG